LLNKATRYGGIVTEKILGGFTDTEVTKEPNDGIVKPGDRLFLNPSYRNGNGLGYKHTDDLKALVYDNYVRKPPRGEVYLQCTSTTDCQHDTFKKVKEWLGTFDSFTLGFKVKDENESFLDGVLVSGNKLTANSSTHFFEVPVNSKTISEIRNSNPPLEVEISQAGYISKKVSVKADIDALLDKTAVYTLRKPLKFNVVDESNNPLDGVKVDVVGVGEIGQTLNGGILAVEVDKSKLKLPSYTLNLSKLGYETRPFNLDLATINDAISKGSPIVYGLKTAQAAKFDVTIKACKEGTAIISRRVQICSLPLENVMVEITKDGKAVDLQLKTTGQDGRLKVSLEQGTYNIALSKDGYSNKSDTLTVSNQLEEKSFFLYSQTLTFEVLAKNADGTDANAVNVCLWSAPTGTLEVASTGKQMHSCDTTGLTGLTGLTSFKNVPFYENRTYWAQIGDDTKNISSSFKTSVSYAATNKLPAHRLEIKIPAPVSPKLTFNIVVKEKDTGNPVKTEKVCLEIAATLFRCVSVTNDIITINNVDYLPNKDYMVAAYIGNIAYTSTPISYVELPTQPIGVVIEVPASTVKPICSASTCTTFEIRLQNDRREEITVDKVCLYVDEQEIDSSCRENVRGTVSIPNVPFKVGKYYAKASVSQPINSAETEFKSPSKTTVEGATYDKIELWACQKTLPYDPNPDGSQILKSCGGWISTNTNFFDNL
jgi:hypothetical protein